MNLILILGDQLSKDISSLQDANKERDIIMLCELRTEATYVKHHKKKIALIFSAMRHFAQSLRDDGYTVRYVPYDDAKNTGHFTGELARAITNRPISKVIVTQAGEYRLAKEFANLHTILGIDVTIKVDDRFICAIEEFSDWADGRKQLRMEYFYRQMRRKTGILMQGDQPVGGQWNYDAQNRKPAKTGLNIPPPHISKPDKITQDVLTLVSDTFADHFGDLEPFDFAVTRDDALAVLDRFIQERLPNFGDYQDAMIQNEAWMFHSHISFYLNCGLLTPREVLAAAEAAYLKGDAPLNAVEGFVRQILGWREYVRGLYWLHMPNYKTMNALNATRALPEFFWDADTQMNCMRQCISETKQNAYAHHIQRLMVLGNFALLTGLDPDQVNDWYMLVYADAYEWVELPNVTGMILFADGGIMASKPYAASGAYINKMSNYCASCTYSVTKKNGPKACPFNYLYWNFMDRNSDKLRGNPRLSLVYRNLDRQTDEKRAAVRDDAARFLKSIDAHEKV